MNDARNYLQLASDNLDELPSNSSCKYRPEERKLLVKKSLIPNYKSLMKSLFGPPVEDDSQHTVFSTQLTQRHHWTNPVVIYHCFGGVHTSVTAAAIHCERIPGQVPLRNELEEISRFNTLDAEIGEIHHAGYDRRGLAIKSAGFGSHGDQLLDGAILLLCLSGYNRSQIITRNTLSTAGIVLRLGGFLSCRLKFRRVGDPLVWWGIERSFSQLLDLVEQMQKRLENFG